MEIPDPIAYPEQKVLVRNYRLKPPAWEMGTVNRFHFVPSHTRTDRAGSRYEVDGRWSFDVWVERPVVQRRYGRPRGGGYMLGVDSESIAPWIEGGE